MMAITTSSSTSVNPRRRQKRDDDMVRTPITENEYGENPFRNAQCATNLCKPGALGGNPTRRKQASRNAGTPVTL